MRIESLEFSFIFSISISNPAKNRRNTIPRTDKKSTIIREGSSNNKPLITEMPSSIPARICPTTGGKPTFLKTSLNTKDNIKIIGTTTSVSTIFLTPRSLDVF